MGLIEIIIIAIGLSMDAFAVSITLGLSVNKQKVKEILMPGLFFGLFQAVMPIIGYFAGINFVDIIQHLAHWIAFILLGFIGVKMIKESISKRNNEKNNNENSFKFIKLLVLAIATSIDAFAIGITFALLQVNIFGAALIIGLTTFIIAMVGVKIGNIFGIKYKAKAEFIGGMILILLGIKILVESLLQNGR